MSYNLETRLRTLEKKQNRTSGRVIIVFISPSGKGYLDADGKRVNIQKFRTVIVDDIPKGG